MSGVGFVLPVLSIGLGSINIRPQRGFYPGASDVGPMQPLVAQATLEEIHHDELDISEHPVELGASIADHAIKRPAEVVIRCLWSNSPSTNPGIISAALGVVGVRAPIVGKVLGAVQTVTAAGSLLSGNSTNQANAIYQQLLELQNQRIPFNILTGKRAYKDMLFKSLSVTTDKQTENSLLLTAVCRQVIIVRTQTVNVPINTSAQGQPQKTSPVIDAGQRQLQAVRRAVNPELFQR